MKWEMEFRVAWIRTQTLHHRSNLMATLETIHQGGIHLTKGRQLSQEEESSKTSGKTTRILYSRWFTQEFKPVEV